MTQDRNTIIANALNKLFRTYEQSGRNIDPAELARERMEKAKVYFEAVASYEAQDVDRAVTAVLAGDVPAGWNLAYAPSAPQVGSAVRRAMERRLESERLSKLSLPPPVEDFVQDPPEVRARNRAKLDQLVADLAKNNRTEDAEGARIKADLDERTRRRFAPSMEKRDMIRRLGIGSYFVGDDPEAEYGDMGQSRAQA